MPEETLHLKIGFLIFDKLDQIDLTGPFEILASLPNATCRLYGLSSQPVRDAHGLQLVPDAAIEDAPQLDILQVPGGPGQEALMEDERVLGWLRNQSAGAGKVLSVCTGALICGAAGLLQGRRATTHWASHHLLPYFGAIPVNERVVIDGDWIFAAGVTAGIDGALRLVAEMRGQAEAERIQLRTAYAPEPPFNSGTPETAPPDVLSLAREAASALTSKRLATAQRVAKRLGIEKPLASGGLAGARL